MDNEKYTKYFNYGYFLSRREPGVLKKLIEATKEKSEIHEPLKAGMNEYQREKMKEQFKRISNERKRGQDQDRDKGLER